MVYTDDILCTLLADGGQIVSDLAVVLNGRNRRGHRGAAPVTCNTGACKHHEREAPKTAHVMLLGTRMVVALNELLHANSTSESCSSKLF